MLVVDSNVVVKWFVDESLHAEARHIYKYQQDILAPEFVLVEVANVTWKKVRRKEIGADQAYEIINLAFKALPGFIHSPDILVQATKLAIELAHPVYDCLYLACINESRDALVTGDKRFFNKVKDTRFGDRIRFLDDPDLQLPLYISLHKVNEIIGLSDLIEETHRNLIFSLKGEERFAIVNTTELQPLFDSPAYRRLAAEIEDLSAVEQMDVLALGWLGQGYSGNDWRSIRNRAESTITNNDRQFLRYVASLAVYLGQGLARLRKPQ